MDPGGKLYKSTDSGANWSASDTGLPGDDILALAIDQATSSTIYAATSSSGVYKTTDSGANWSAINTGLTSTDVQALAIGSVYAGTVTGGVFQSEDDGATWAALNTGLSVLDVRVIAVDTAAGPTIYAATAGGGVFEYTLGAGPVVPTFQQWVAILLALSMAGYVVWRTR